MTGVRNEAGAIGRLVQGCFVGATAWVNKPVIPLVPDPAFKEVDPVRVLGQFTLRSVWFFSGENSEG